MSVCACISAHLLTQFGPYNVIPKLPPYVPFVKGLRFFRGVEVKRFSIKGDAQSCRGYISPKRMLFLYSSCLMPLKALFLPRLALMSLYTLKVTLQCFSWCFIAHLNVFSLSEKLWKHTMKGLGFGDPYSGSRPVDGWG